MNLFMQYCFLVVLVLLLEDIETGDTYKLIRPYKYYKRRPRPPRWLKGHRSSKFYHSKRIPQEDYYSRRPEYYRYPTNEDVDSYVENKPYTIVIQLPKDKYEEDKYGYNDYSDRKRNYEREMVTAFSSESDYIDDAEDESKVVNVNKRVQIKMVKGDNSKLHIKISRSDVNNDIEIVDKSNITAVELPLLTKANANSMSLLQQMGDNWTSPEPFTVDPGSIERK